MEEVLVGRRTTKLRSKTDKKCEKLLTLVFCLELTVMCGSNPEGDVWPCIEAILVDLKPTTTFVLILNKIKRIKKLSQPAVKALMIEDLQMAQKVASRIFAKLNCQLDVVGLATKALEKIVISHYDIIFIDIQLPDINGLDLAQTLRLAELKDTHIPIIIVTSNPTEELRKHAKSIGCDDFMQKPLTLNSVRDIFLKYIAKNKQNLMNLNAV